MTGKDACTNDMKLTRQNMKYFVFILSAMKYKYEFRNHYFLFLFAFSILSQLFLIWGCIYNFYLMIKRLLRSSLSTKKNVGGYIIHRITLMLTRTATDQISHKP